MSNQPAAARSRRRQWLWVALALVCLARLLVMAWQPFTGLTEARYAEIARKMLETGNWVTPWIDDGVPFWGKPPLAFWSSAAGMAVFGVNEFAARLPSFLFGLGTLWLVGSLAGFRYGRGTGVPAALILAGSALFFFNSGAVMTDAALTFAVTLAMVGFWRARAGERRWGYAFFAGLGIGLLAKGPLVGVLTVIPLALWALWRRDRAALHCLPWVGGVPLMLVIAVPWYALAEIRTPGFLEYFIVGEHIKRFVIKGWSGDLYGYVHSHPPGMIWVFGLLGALPWSLWLPMLWWRRRTVAARLTRDEDWSLYLLLWAGVPLAFFTFARNIIPSYALPALPPAALLAALLLLRRGPDAGNPAPRCVPILALVIPLLAVAAGAAVRGLPPWLDNATQKRLVAHYLARRPGPDSPLVYFQDRDHTAEFYSRGAARNVTTIEGLRALLDNSTRDYLVLRKSRVFALPRPMKPRFQPVGAFGDKLLLEEQAPSPSRGARQGE